MTMMMNQSHNQVMVNNDGGGGGGGGGGYATWLTTPKSGDGHGSMKGLIRLRNDDEGEGEGVIDVDHDLSRFEMVYPSNGGERSSLENRVDRAVSWISVALYHDYTDALLNTKSNPALRVDDQDSHIARLEEENMVLKERLFYMEREFGNLRNRLQSLEVKKQNDSDNDCGSNDNDNNDENECSVHNDDHKMEDEDNATVEAKDRKLNGMVVNVDSSDINIELTETIDDMVGDGLC
ncbi:hypothetical protein Tco_1410321 [Tanacetum coccineum]